LEGEAHGRSGASRAGRLDGGGRDGGTQTPDAARGDGGSRRLYASGSAGLRLCRRARKPRRGSIAGHVARRPSGCLVTLRCGAAMTRLRRSTKAQAGPASVFGPSRGSEDENPKGVERRTGRAATHTRPTRLRVRVPGAPRNSTGGCYGSPRGGVRHSFQPSHLWRATSIKGTDSLVRVC
jgi:hypothetical protein